MVAFFLNEQSLFERIVTSGALKNGVAMFDAFKSAYLPETDFPIREIDGEKCVQCGRCYEVCPTYGIRWKTGEPPRPVGYGGLPQACLNCGNCVAVCPAGAISIRGSYAVREGRYKTLLLHKVCPPNPLRTVEPEAYTAFKDELTEVERVIYTRRSNRLFKSTAMPGQMLERILEAGRFAPSAGNCQPYKFIVITDPKTIGELERKSLAMLRVFKNLYLLKNGKKPLWKKALFTLLSWLMINKMDQRPVTAMEKADKTGGALYFNAPAVILVLKDTRGISNPDLDAGICCQNMVLAAHSLGLGTCYVGLAIEPLNTALMAGFRKKIGIRRPFEAVTSIAVGYPKGKIDGIVPRDTPETVWIS